MSPVVPLGGLIAAVAMWLALHGMYKVAFRWKVNTAMFMKQIRMQIMANRIDQAVKLTDAFPDALLPKAIRTIIVKANRTYHLTLSYEEAMADVRLRVHGQRQHSIGSFLVSLLALVILWLGLSRGLEGRDLQLLQWSMVLTASSAALALLVTARLSRMQADIEAAALHCRNLLYYRANYAPPHHEPIALTAEELARWQESMAALEEEASAPGSPSASDLHDSQVDRKTGVLPPR